MIAEEAWSCIWQELIVYKKGLKTVSDRPNGKVDYNFSGKMLEEMILELSRLITNYSGPDWNAKETANRVIDLLIQHRALIQTELNEVNSGMRKLTDKDFLGPKEWARRLNLQDVKFGGIDDDRFKYFLDAEQKFKDKKVAEFRKRALELSSEKQIKQGYYSR